MLAVRNVTGRGGMRFAFIWFAVLCVGDRIEGRRVSRLLWTVLFIAIIYLLFLARVVLGKLDTIDSLGGIISNMEVEILSGLKRIADEYD